MIIDTHVHIIGLNASNDCYISPRLAAGPVYHILARALGLKDVSRENLDTAFRKQLIGWVLESDLDGAGLLAFDAVYDEHGRRDQKRTQFYISNDYCLALCKESEKLLPICSVNPQRRDALEELERVVEAGAVAIKLLPNTHGIDLMNPAYTPFWQRMCEHKIPLLTHTSFEHTLPVISQKYGAPERLRAPLDEGVTVIAAHCASAGVIHFREHIHTWFAMLEEYPNLYGDISAMASPARFPYLQKVLHHSLARDRVMLGSDFPVPVSPIVFVARLGLKKCLQLHRIQNPLQRNLEVFREMGVDDAILRRASKVLRL